MNTKTTIFHGGAAPVRTATPGYRILRRIVAMRRAGVPGIHDAGSIYRAVSRTFPTTAE